MATKKTATKKTATKKTRAKKTSAKPASTGAVTVPAGFRPTSGSYAQTWNPLEQGAPQELVGEWGEERTITVKRGRGTQEQRVCTVTTDEGIAYTIWASAMLVALFDEAEAGDRVYIRFDGLGVAKKGQNPPKLFTTAIAE